MNSHARRGSLIRDIFHDSFGETTENKPFFKSFRTQDRNSKSEINLINVAFKDRNTRSSLKPHNAINYGFEFYTKS